MKSREQLIDEVVWLQEKLNSLVSVFKTEKWMKLDLTIDQLKSLILIKSKGKISCKELAGALNITRSNITGIADRLVQSGLVNRNQNLKGDRRIQYLMLTEKGKGVLDDIKHEIISNEKNIFNAMNDEDQIALEKGMSAFVRSAERYILFQQKELETENEKITQI